VKGFKAFLLRGNVVDLAVAVMVGVAFGVVVTAFVKDMVTPLIAAIGGNPDFSSLSFTVNNSKFLYGDFLNAAIAFLIVVAVIYFFVVVPYSGLMTRIRKEPPADPTIKKCPECLSDIPIDARRCAFCGELVAKQI
jgi:large conductance mechanosensitive channel